MYTTCCFCYAALGSNDAIDAFPVGQRLAFDPARGRLWAVCRACGRWNLTPLGERWAAIEECERRFRGSRLRAGTGEIGIARLPERVDLVRIGQPPRPEFAAWRYGSQLVTRHRRQWLRRMARAMLHEWESSDVARGATWVGIQASVMMITPMLVLVAAPAAAAIQVALSQRKVTAIADETGRARRIARWQLAHVRWGYGDSGGRELVVPWLFSRPVRLVGSQAERALSTLLVHSNDVGASERQVDLAVRKLEHFGSAERLMHFMGTKREGGVSLSVLGYEQRLALEMALHEDTERRAMEGELLLLEDAWRQAETIAKIADGLFDAPGEVTGT